MLRPTPAQHPALAPWVTEAILDRANDLAAGSYFHGPRHWRLVAQVGWYLADHYADVDPVVVYLFGVIHDTKRESERRDPEHGHRSASLAMDLYHRGDLPISEIQLFDLVHALRIHNGYDPRVGPVIPRTVAACLDADRLNLWRVGKTPDPELLCTDFAKRPSVILWARRLNRPAFLSAPTDLTWDQLRHAFGLLVRTRRAVLDLLTPS